MAKNNRELIRTERISMKFAPEEKELLSNLATNEDKTLTDMVLKALKEYSKMLEQKKHLQTY